MCLQHIVRCIQKDYVGLKLKHLIFGFCCNLHEILLPVKPLLRTACALTTVLASGTSCTWSTMERLWEVVRVWDGELVGQGHGPGGCPRVGQRMEGVLI